ncbi:hypothetical protein GQ53DRAFT_851989 [Thozetella sp. PMI_491]|nr:hypothetical protein GQ53DRAFT_851989 [Thozetella sp. PMI_491]
MDQFQCSSCNKTFTSANKQQRHQLRCRGRPKVRKRACAECTRAKTRCDEAFPCCSRCGVKSLHCQYPGRIPAATEEACSSVCIPSRSSAVASLALYANSVYARQDSSTRHSTIYPDITYPQLPRPGSNMSSSGTCVELNTIPPSLDLIIADKDLVLIDEIFRYHFDGLSKGGERLSFIHSRHIQPACRSGILNQLSGFLQIYLTNTPEFELYVLELLTDGLAALQVMVMCYAMHVYTTSPHVEDLVDTIATAFVQFIFRQDRQCLEPETNVQPTDWSDWITHESTRRNFFALHSLNIVSNRRTGYLATMCVGFPDVPLPYPTHVWEAATSESWAFHHLAWERYCGEPLRGKDVLAWVNGKITGREDKLQAWFTTTGALGQIILLCAKAQISAARTIALL